MTTIQKTETWITKKEDLLNLKRSKTPDIAFYCESCGNEVHRKWTRKYEDFQLLCAACNKKFSQEKSKTNPEIFISKKEDLKNLQWSYYPKVVFNCESCGAEVHKTYSVKYEDFRMLCQKCAKIDFKITNYGSVENWNKKQEQLLLEKYGVTSTNQLESKKKKIADTLEEHYGVRATLKSPLILQKAQDTMTDRYGAATTLQSAVLKEKVKQTNIEKYGVENPFQVDEFKEQSNKTKIERYGTTHVSYKYCVENEKFDSSWEVAFWIYHKNKDIAIEHEPVTIEYFDAAGKSHSYYPDFRIGNQLYEIKGKQFLKEGKLIDPFNQDQTIAEAKTKIIADNNITLITYDQIKPYLDYMQDNYGAGWSELFKISC